MKKAFVTLLLQASVFVSLTARAQEPDSSPNTTQTQPGAVASPVLSSAPTALPTNPFGDTHGWASAEPRHITPEEMRRIHEAGNKPAFMAAKTLGAGSNPGSIRPPLPPMDLTVLQEAAQGMENDGHVIFQWLQNHFDYTPYYGYAKGPLRTFYDKSGNDLDLAVLLAVLLERSGINNVQIMTGVMQMKWSDMAAWLRLADSSSPTVIKNVLEQVGLPYLEDTQGVWLVRFWVRANIDGEQREMDPAFKRYEFVAGPMNQAELVTAMGYRRAEMYTAANPRVSQNWKLDSLNVSGLKTYLNQLRTQLSAHPVFADRSIGADRLLGNWQRVNPTSPYETLPAPTTLRFPVSFAESLGSWTTLPESYKTLIEIIHPDWATRVTNNGMIKEYGVLIPTADVSGRQLSLSIEGGHYPPLPWPVEGQVAGTHFPPAVSNAGETKDYGTPSWATFERNRHNENNHPQPRFLSPSRVINIQAPVGGAQTVTFQITNITYSGDGKPMALLHSLIEGSGFELKSVKYDEDFNCNVTLEFKPTQSEHNAKFKFSVKRHNGVYEFYANSNRELFSIELVGFGTYPQMVGGGYNFGAVQKSEPSGLGVTKNCQIINNSGETLSISSISVTQAAFSQKSWKVGDSIPPGQVINIPVTFRPTSAGLMKGELKIVADKRGDQIGVSLPLQGFSVAIGKAQLKLDGRVIAESTGSQTIQDLQRVAVTLKMTNPGDREFYSSSHAYSTMRTGDYTVPIDFGDSLNGQYVAAIGKRLAALADLPETTVAEKETKKAARLLTTLEMMGASWYQQTNQANHLLGRLFGERMHFHHRTGLVAQEYDFVNSKKSPLGYYIDVGNQFASPFGVSTGLRSQSIFENTGLVISALEHGILEQMQVHKASSTTRMIENALDPLDPSITPVPVYKLSKTEFDYLRSQPEALKGYSDSFLTQHSANLASDPSAWIMLPANGEMALSKGGWKGYGAMERLPNSIAMLISGDYNGGYSAMPAEAGHLYSNRAAELAAMHNEATPPQPSSTEPINLVTGEYYYDHTDLTIGGLAFARHYSSASARSKSALGYGWTHNWDAGVEQFTDSAMAFGSRHAQDAVCAIVAFSILNDLKDHPTDSSGLQWGHVSGWAIRAIVTNWCVDALKNNATQVSVGNKVLVYSSPNNGLAPFFPPPGVTDELSKPTGLTTALTPKAFDLKSRDGSLTTFRNVGSGDLARSAVANIVNPDGLKLTISYGKDFLVDKVLDASGRGFVLTYDAAKMLTSVATVKDTVVRKIGYGYDGSATQNLITITDPEQKRTTFQYAVPSNHYLTSLRDGLDRTIASNDYNSQGKAIRQRAYGDADQTWLYFFSDLRTVQVDPQSGRLSYYFDDQKRTIGQRDEVGALRKTGYNFNNQTIVSVDAENHTTLTEYDSFLRPQTVIYPDGTRSTQSYDDLHRPIESLSRGGKRTVQEYLGSNLRHRPDVVKVYENATKFLTTRYTYHTEGLKIGQVKTVTDPAGRTVTLDYDALGQPASSSREVEVDDGIGSVRNTLVVSRTIYNARGDLVETIDELGRRTRHSYNARRQKLTETIAYGTPDVYTVTTVYDNAGDSVRSFDSLPQSYKTGQTFSAQGKPLRSYRVTKDGLFDDSLTSLFHVSETLYDSRDWPSVTRFLAASPIAGARAEVTTVPYANGRVRTVTDPVGRVVTHASSPEQTTTSVTDDEGFRVVTQTDVLSRRKIISDAFKAPTQGGALEIPANVDRLLYIHDPDGELRSLTNRLNNTYQMFYTGLGQLQQQTTPGQRATRYSYTAAGQVENITAPDGSSTTLRYYPKSGQLRTHTDALGSIEHRYDAGGNLTSLTSGTQSLRSDYDHAGRLSVYTDSRGQKTAYGYYPNGLLKFVRYHAQDSSRDQMVTYRYNADRSLRAVTDWDNRVTEFDYYQDGKLRGIHRPNGTHRTFSYTLAGELESLVESSAAMAKPVIYFAKFSFNDRGQVSRRQFFPPQPLNAQRTTAMSAVAGADNQLLSVNNQAQDHDLRGNLRQGVLPDGSSTATYEFDARNRLIALNGSSTYGYDQSSARVRVVEAGQVTEFGVAPLGGLSQVLTEKRPGNVERAYVYTPSGQLLHHIETSIETSTSVIDEETGEVITMSSSPVMYYHYDLTGSTVALSGEDGLVKGRVSYTAYGEITSRSGNTETRFLFCGAYGVQTDASGLVHMRARYYNPYTCRFISEDPIGFEGGMNWYGYCGGDPLNLVDPTGLEGWSPDVLSMMHDHAGYVTRYSLASGSDPQADPVATLYAMGEEFEDRNWTDPLQDSMIEFHPPLANLSNKIVSFVTGRGWRSADIGPGNIHIETAIEISAHNGSGNSFNNVSRELVTVSGQAYYASHEMGRVMQAMNDSGFLNNVTSYQDRVGHYVAAWREGPSRRIAVMQRNLLSNPNGYRPDHGRPSGDLKVRIGQIQQVLSR